MFANVKICGMLLLLLLIKLKTTTADETTAPIVTLPQGKIQGHVLQSPLENKLYYAYQDIPYAAPPVGSLRFQEPVEPENWDGILNTTHNTHSCYLSGQDSERAPDVVESEDCLYLNVYTTIEPGSDSSPIPVLFWIHGGGFVFGDGTFQVYGPQYLIDYDIVIVTINYRLGAFGFLATDDGVIPGNLGLKDQNLAMKWVQKNIALFGGDPSKVTIAGESAGGASVGFHVISKRSEGLFRGAILQSGTAICSFSHQAYANYFAFKMGTTLDPNFTGDNTTALLELLQSVSADEINNITLEVPEDIVEEVGSSILWVPVIETESLDSALITTPMHEDIRTGNINKVPIMIGYNSEEAIVFVGNGESTKKQARDMDNDLSKVVHNKYNMADKDKEEAGRQIRQLYTDSTFAEKYSGMVKFLTDTEFTTPTVRHAELQSNYTDVYLYQFSYKGKMGRTNVTIEGVDGVGHAEDLKYLWHIDRLDDGSTFPAADILTQKRLLTLWSNFVKYLNPTPESDTLFDNTVWTKLNQNELFYFNINKTIEVKTDPRQYKQYKEIVEKYAVPPLISY